MVGGCWLVGWLVGWLVARAMKQSQEELGAVFGVINDKWQCDSQLSANTCAFAERFVLFVFLLRLLV